MHTQQTVPLHSNTAAAESGYGPAAASAPLHSLRSTLVEGKATKIPGSP